jgi:hypothetical protein
MSIEIYIRTDRGAIAGWQQDLTEVPACDLARHPPQP